MGKDGDTQKTFFYKMMGGKQGAGWDGAYTSGQRYLLIHDLTYIDLIH